MENKLFTTINLVDIVKSDIKYKISRFPDGQQNINILGWTNDHSAKYLIVLIKARLNNFLDLELITCTVASLRELGVEQIHLYTPYIMGARSDRKFEEGGNNYLKDVICPIINSLNFKSVTCIDPHSDVLEACIKGFKKKSNLELVEFALYETYQDNWRKETDDISWGHYRQYDLMKKDNFILISPDAGASKKIYKLAEQIGYKGDVITCSKDRDSEGKLTKTVVPVSTIVNKDYIIIDDICDGGATFINIAKVLKAQLHESNRIYLIITHGVFSKGFEELSKYFDGIYCANSYSDLLDNFETFPDKATFNKTKQLNVF